ncbi:MAG: hypothetical protein MZV70_16410 [Desulfobacterales bacterium]|nr:hypothetical protein [Desulfobacterales bacterium]
MLKDAFVRHFGDFIEQNISRDYQFSSGIIQLVRHFGRREQRAQTRRYASGFLYGDHAEIMGGYVRQMQADNVVLFKTAFQNVIGESVGEMRQLPGK